MNKFRLPSAIGEVITKRRERRLPLEAATYAEIVDDVGEPKRPTAPFVNSRAASEGTVGMDWSDVGIENMPAIYADLVVSAVLRGAIEPEERDARLLMMSEVARKDDAEGVNQVFTEFVERLMPPQNLQ